MSWRTLYSLVISCSIIFSNQLFAQCVVTASVLNDISVCGDCVELSAFGRGQGQIVFQENFNSGAPTGWAFTQQAQFNNPCSPNGVNGTKHIWMGSTSAVPRSLETLPYNFSTAASGVTICFDMLFAEQGDAAPCEGPDEPDEGVYLQYRVGSGTWTTIHYFDPNGGYDPLFINWNNWCFPLPPGATTGNVSIRWFQDNDSGADFDHWGIDNVQIYFNDPTYQISWPHNSFSYPVGSSGGVNTNPSCPRATTDYVVVMTNGSSTCRDTVRVTVVSPTIEVDAGADLTLCPNQCDTLNATAKVIKSPAKRATYSNAEFIDVPTLGGSKDSININVTNLNMTTLSQGSIVSVCITGLTFFGGTLLPPTLATIGDLRLNLICPGGGTITLVPIGVTSSSNPFVGYINTCFTPVSTRNIATATSPYGGNFRPSQPFSGLDQCNPNGLWSIEIAPGPNAAAGVGIFSGWSITFDDPEINYTATFTWNPTTHMTNSNTLTPTVCPPVGTHTYELIGVDSGACVIARDTIDVTVVPTCCNLTFTATSTPPACAAADGSISINIISGSGNYTFAWNDGSTTQNRTALASGIYTVTVTDTMHTLCSFDTTITLTSPGAPAIDSISITHETCLGYADGTAVASVTGGTGALTYTWSTTETGISIDSLAAGTYTVTVTDANSCADIETFIINPGPVCCTLHIAATVTPPTCGLSDGGIDMNVVTGSGNYTFAWTPAASTEDLNAIPAGIYSVTVTDVTQNCNRDTTITLTNPNAPVIDSVTFTPTTCAGGTDGTATVHAHGGTGSLSYEWDNTETTQTISGLTARTYLVTVTDANQCETSGSVAVADGPICCNLASTVDTVNTTCAGNDGSLTIHVITSSGTAPFEFSIDGVNYGSDSVFSGLVAGSYDAIARDINLCADTTTVTITEPANTIATTVTATDISCFGETDGTASVVASGGNAPLALAWSTTSTNDTITGLAAGTYRLTVTDQSNCTHIDSATIAEPDAVTVNLDDQSICTDSTATLTIGNYDVIEWSTGELNVTTISLTQPGAVSVTVTDASGCTASDNANVTAYSSPVITLLDTATIYDFETVTLNTTVSGTLNPAGFIWTPSDGLTCADCQSPTASPDSSIIYYLTYYDLNTCPAYDTVEITVLDGEYFAIVPNAFTPNGDGPNDVLHVYHKALERMVFRIYNRWGSLVFQTTDPNQGWDGTHKGKELSPDVFVYELYAEFVFDVKPQRTKGSITLLR